MGRQRGLSVDAGYRTRLGTSFYNRVSELNLLEECLGAVRTLIVYGPRNVGKSELIRYYAARRAKNRGVVLIDARRGVAEQYLGGGLERVAERLAALLAEAAGLPRGLVALVEELVRAARRPSLIVIDEFHLLLHGRLREALAELEALAGLLAKGGVAATRVVVVVSEGFFATMEALHRLHGYSVDYLLVEPMDVEHFAALYEEYRELRGCGVSLDAYLGLVDAAPGYLPDLCPRSKRLLLAWMNAELQHLDAAIIEAAEAAGLEPSEARRVAAELLKGEPPRDARRLKVAEKLVELNIAYPCMTRPRRYLPQLPLYLEALEARVEPAELLRRLEERGAVLRRCGGG